MLHRLIFGYCHHISFFIVVTFLLILKKKGERKRERNISWLFHLFRHSLADSYMPWMGIEPTTKAYRGDASTELPGQGSTTFRWPVPKMCKCFGVLHLYIFCWIKSLCSMMFLSFRHVVMASTVWPYRHTIYAGGGNAERLAHGHTRTWKPSAWPCEAAAGGTRNSVSPGGFHS